MLAKRIIPCLDVHAGRVVKGVRFLDLIDAGDPVECAKIYDRQGADELVFLDISAASENRRTVIEMVEKVAESVYIPFTVGGGISNVQDIRNLLNAGCDKVSLNTRAVENEKLISDASDRFGSQCIVLAVDCKRNDAGSWTVYTHGGRTSTGWDVCDWIERGVDLGAGEILLTSMDCDGTKKGYDIELLQKITSRVDVPVIASGGAGNCHHMADAILDGKADAVLAASIFHFGEIKIQDLKRYLSKNNIFVRLDNVNEGE